MSDTKRHKQLKEIMNGEFFIEGMLDFSDCKSVEAVSLAACKLLLAEFDVGHKGSYIREIIEQACYESRERKDRVDEKFLDDD